MGTSLERLDRYARLWELADRWLARGVPLSDGEASALVGALDGVVAPAGLAGTSAAWSGERVGATLELGARLAVRVREVGADSVEVELDATGAAAAAAADDAARGDLCVIDAVLGVELRIPVELVDVGPPRSSRGDPGGGVATLRVTGAPVRRSFGPAVPLG